MKSIKQLPLLATIGAMVLLALSTNSDWLKGSAVIVGVATLFVFIKANLKKS